MKSTGLFLLLFSLTLTVLAQVPSAINFQGNLTDPITGNVIADNTYDMVFALFDADIDGTELWSESQIGVLVMGGIFNVVLGSVNQMDPVIFSQPVWLQITVNGETLSPRIELAASAYSINSANTQSYESEYTSIPSVGPAYIAGDTSTQNYTFTPPFIDLAIDDNDTGFDVVTDGTLSFYTDAVERMSLNHVGTLNLGSPIAIGSGIKFEINFDDIGTDWGGMYISNSAATARPYYGYYNGNGQAYTYLDGPDANKWKLVNGGLHLTVQTNGNVGIGTTTPSEKLSVNGKVIANDTVKAVGFKYNNPRTLYYSIAPQEFEIASPSTILSKYVPTNGIYVSVQGGSGSNVSLHAPINLPHGAVITGITADVYDGDATYDLSVDLMRHPIGSLSSPFVIASTTATTGSTGFMQTSVSGLSITINNASNAYSLRFNTRDNLPTTMVIYATRITYTVTEPY